MAWRTSPHGPMVFTGMASDSSIRGEIKESFTRFVVCNEGEREYKFKLQGLISRKQYRLRFHDHSAPERVLTGQDLLVSGLTVNLPVPNSSELVFINESSN
jgi:hypothetical protein